MSWVGSGCCGSWTADSWDDAEPAFDPLADSPGDEASGAAAEASPFCTDEAPPHAADAPTQAAKANQHTHFPNTLITVRITAYLTPGIRFKSGTLKRSHMGARPLIVKSPEPAEGGPHVSASQPKSSPGLLTGGAVGFSFTKGYRGQGKAATAAEVKSGLAEGEA